MEQFPAFTCPQSRLPACLSSSGCPRKGKKIQVQELARQRKLVPSQLSQSSVGGEGPEGCSSTAKTRAGTSAAKNYCLSLPTPSSHFNCSSRRRLKHPQSSSLFGALALPRLRRQAEFSQPGTSSGQRSDCTRRDSLRSLAHLPSAIRAIRAIRLRTEAFSRSHSACCCILPVIRLVS